MKTTNSNYIYLIYCLLTAATVWGARFCKKGEWNEEYTSLGQMKILQGVCVLLISFHHMAQKTCASWLQPMYIRHGLDPFVPIGFMLCGVFLFCSSYGLFKSLKTKPEYLDHFLKRRVVPLVIAYYLSEIIYLLVRLYAGEKMSALTVLWYLSGLHMANFNAWYLVAILFFYFIFWAAFRLFKKDGPALLFLFLVTLLYTLAGVFTDHQNDWFMRGEWWYNSILMFPLGFVFAKFEAKITAFLKKGYLIWLVLVFAGLIASFKLSVHLTDSLWGYYGETWNDPLKIQHRLGCCAGQWLACFFAVAFGFLLTLKVRLGNGLLSLLGRCTLEYYLMHGIFVELFGFNFQDICKSLKYIKDVPLYVLTVLACSAAATAVFHYLWKGLVKLTAPRAKAAEQSENN